MSSKVHFVFSLYLIIARCNAYNKDYFCQPGAIADLDLIYSENGVPVDFSFNETSYDNADGLSSVPGCPKSLDGYPWVLHHLPNASRSYQNLRCYVAGTKGPCPDRQLLYAQMDSIYGVCSCECLHLDSDRIVKDDRKFHYCEGRRGGQIYDKFDKSICYQTQTQGPCRNGTVISSVYLKEKEMLSWDCLPNCDIEYKIANPNAKCAHFDSIPLSGVANLGCNKCSEGLKYSKTLKKCIKRRNINLIF